MTRSIALLKTVTYRVVGTTVTFVASYVMTGSLVISSTISAAEFTIKPFTYYLHERAWSKAQNYLAGKRTWEDLPHTAKFLPSAKT
jgi:uncharacterized membrane protein